MPTLSEIWRNPDKLKCPECRSVRLGLYGFRRISRKRKHQYICKHCGRVTLNPLGGK